MRLALGGTALLLFRLLVRSLASCPLGSEHHGLAYGAPELGCCEAPLGERLLCDPRTEAAEDRARTAAACAELAGGSPGWAVVALNGSWRGCEAQCEADPECEVWSLQPAGFGEEGRWRPAVCRLAPAPLDCAPAHCALEGAVTGRKDCGAVTVRRLAEGEVSIRVVSAGYSDGNTAEFYLDGQKLALRTQIGMNVVTLHANGTLDAFQTFNTHASGGSSALGAFLDGLPTGTVVLIAVKDEANAALRSADRAVVAQCGATLIDSFAYRSSYALIGVKGGARLAEVVRPENAGRADTSFVYSLGSPALVGEVGPVNIKVVSEGFNSLNAGTAQFYLGNQELSVPTGRGLNVVLLTANGTFNSSHVFDTHGSGGAGPLVELFNGLAVGTPVLVAARDNANTGMTAAAEEALAGCGATSIAGLGYRSAYALIGLKGGPKLAETLLPQDGGPVEALARYDPFATTTTTLTATTTTPLPPCVDFQCPADQVLKLTAATLRGSDAVDCCEAADADIVGLMVKSAGYADGSLAEFYIGGSRLSFRARRGMNVVVLRPDGSPVRTGDLGPQTFDTNQPGPASNLTDFLNGLENGTVVLMAAKDEAKEQLSDEAKAAIAACGGTRIGEFRWRSAYALIGVKGGAALAEEVLRTGSGVAVAVAHLTVDPAAARSQAKPVCNARVSNPPVVGWAANNQLELEAGCRYQLWEGADAGRCLDGSWMVVVGGSNTVLMALRLANMIVPEAIMPVRDGATMGGFTVVDVILRGGRLVYGNSQLLPNCSALPYDDVCKAAIAAHVAAAPAYAAGDGGTRLTLFEARFWDHADVAMQTLLADARWAAAPMGMLVQVSTWYIYCASMKLSWCPRENLKAESLTHPQALTLFTNDMAPVVSKLETLCAPGGRAEKHGCWVATTSFQNPSPSRLPFYNDYNAAIFSALSGKTSEVLRVIDLWTLGKAFPEENILGHGSPLLNLWNWQVMLGGMCPPEDATAGTFAEFQGALCFGSEARRVPIPGLPDKYDLAPTTGAKCPNYWSACPTQGGSHLRCEPWECANSVPCTLQAVVRDEVVANLTGACSADIAYNFSAAVYGGPAPCSRVWCDDGLQFLPPSVAVALVALFFSSSFLLARYAPERVKQKLGLGAADAKKADGKKAAAGGPKGGEAPAPEAGKAGGKEAAAAAAAPPPQFVISVQGPSTEDAPAARAPEALKVPAPGGVAKDPSTSPKMVSPTERARSKHSSASGPALLLDLKDHCAEGAERAGPKSPKSPVAVVVAVQDGAAAKPPADAAGKAASEAKATGGKDAAAAAKPKGAGDKFPLGLARMCASLHVVVGHLYAKSDVIPSIYFFGWGFTWVPWFFMLSGFVLFTAHLRRPKDEGVFEYVMRRSVTIYPLYAVSLIPAFITAKVLDNGPSAIILVAQSWLLQAWVPFWTEKALQMHCWFLSAMVVYWFLFKPLSRCLRSFELRATVCLMVALFLLPWMFMFTALSQYGVTWYKEHYGTSTATWLDLAVVFLKFHPLCYLHVFVLGMLLAKLRLCLDAKAVAAGMPLRWRLPLEFVAPAGYAGLFLIFAWKELQPPGWKLSTRLSVLLPFQAAILFGLAGLPSLPQGRMAAFASRFDFLENYSYAVYVFQFICYSVWPKQKDINLFFFLVFLVMTAVFMVHMVQRPVQRWWAKHPRARWGIPVALSLALGGSELFLPRSRGIELPAFIRHDSRMIDVRLAITDDQGNGGSLMNPTLLVKDGRVLLAARRHRLEVTQRHDDGSCAAYTNASGCTILDQTWYSEILVGSAPFDAAAWGRWPRSGQAPFEEATLAPWAALRTPAGQPWAHLCVRQEYDPANNTLVRHVVTGPEDPKLVSLSSNGTAVVFSSLPPLGADGCPASIGLAPVTQMYMAELSDEPARAVGHRVDHGSRVDHEKNWIPFVAAEEPGKLLFVYEPVPHTIISCEESGNLTCQASFARQFPPLDRFQSEHSGLAEWRGSGQAVLIEDFASTPSLPRRHYLGLLHAVELKTKKYLHFAYRFTAEPPYAILQVSQQLPLQAAAADPNSAAFAFASGLSVEGDVVTVTYGAGDRDARALVMTADRLEELFACQPAHRPAANGTTANNTAANGTAANGAVR